MFCKQIQPRLRAPLSVPLGRQALQRGQKRGEDGQPLLGAECGYSPCSIGALERNSFSLHTHPTVPKCAFDKPPKPRVHTLKFEKLCCEQVKQSPTSCRKPTSQLKGPTAFQVLIFLVNSRNTKIYRHKIYLSSVPF